MLVQYSKRILFFFILLLALMIWSSPSVGQIIESEGYASWYNRGHHGELTASGEYYDQSAMTAAHPYLPFDSMVRVTRLDNGRSVVVRINDRMTPGPGHIIDLSGAAAARLGLQDANVARVRIELEDPDDLLQVRERLAARRVQRDEEESITLAARREPPAPRSTEWTPKSGTSAQKASVAAGNEGAADGYRYTLQVGVFSTRPAASAFAGGLENGWVREVSDSGKQLFRVYYDRFSEEPPARDAQKRLKERGFDSFLREIL